MRGTALLVALVWAAAAAAEELTVGEVIAAHRAGAPVEGIVRLVSQAPEVAVPTAAELARLRSAGVPEAVIAAIAARHAPSPTPTRTRPDDPALEEVVRVVAAGLSDRLVCEQIRQSGVRHRLSANDLVYLKERGVSETVIAALLATAASPSPTPTSPPAAALPPAPAAQSPPPPAAPALATPTPPPAATPAVALVFEPLLRMSGTFRKAQAGRLVLTARDLEWSDLADPAQVSRTAASSLRAVWLSSPRRGQAPGPAELRVRTTAGDDLAFRDVDARADSRVEALYRAIAERFPRVVVAEKQAP